MLTDVIQIAADGLEMIANDSLLMESVAEYRETTG